MLDKSSDDILDDVRARGSLYLHFQKMESWRPSSALKNSEICPHCKSFIQQFQLSKILWLSVSVPVWVRVSVTLIYYLSHAICMNKRSQVHVNLSNLTPLLLLISSSISPRLSQLSWWSFLSFFYALPFSSANPSTWPSRRSPSLLRKISDHLLHHITLNPSPSSWALHMWFSSVLCT